MKSINGNCFGLKALHCAAATVMTASLGLAAETHSKPNIILILIDDMGYGDVGPFGSTKNRTPHLDRMAKEGMKLTSCYAAPVCTPSRAQVLTGCYAQRVGLPAVIAPGCPIGLNPEEHTLAKLLKGAGYATMCIGKWHVGDQPEFLPTRYGFDHYFGLPYSNDMGGSETGKLPAKLSNGKVMPPLPLVRDDAVIEIVPPRAQDFLTERYTEEALAFIRTNREKPFFLYLPHTAVHVPIHPGDQFKGKSANGPYGDWVEEVDWSVGRILDTLRELKIEKNTLVIFTSDNGPWLIKGKDSGTTGPLRGSKGSTFEGGMREPTVAWWPGKVPAGTSSDAVVGNIDFLPTFSSLAGAPVPNDKKIDGKDLTPLLTGKSKDSPHESYFYFNRERLEAVRSGPWKLALVQQSEGMGMGAKNKPKTDPKEQPASFSPALYNLESDIGETTNVAAQHPEIVRRLENYAASMNADIGNGSGVRLPGRVPHPGVLMLPGLL